MRAIPNMFFKIGTFKKKEAKSVISKKTIKCYKLLACILPIT